MRKKYLFLILIILLTNVYLVVGLDHHHVNAGGRKTITEHSECRRVFNKEGLALFVPTRTSAEWNSVIAYNSQWFGAISFCTASASGSCYDAGTCTTQYYGCTPSSCLKCIGSYCCYDYYAGGCGDNILGRCPGDCYT